MKSALIAALLALAPASGAAEETAAFLKIGVGARALGMGGAYTAVANDVNSIAWNPAGLAGVGKRELGVTHTQLAADTRYDVLAYGQALSYGTLAVSGGSLGQGAIDSRDDSGHAAGSFTAGDSVVNVGYGAKLALGMRLGGAVKYVQSRIASYSAQTYAVDLGGQYELGYQGPGVPIVAAAVQNVGPGMRFLDQRSALPLTVAAGTAYRLPLGLTFAADYKYHPNLRSSEISVGTEYSLLSNFAIRGGYGSARALNGGTTTGAAASLNGMAAGFGIRMLGYTVDYSITPFGELGNVQRFSLGARF